MPNRFVAVVVALLILTLAGCGGDYPDILGAVKSNTLPGTGKMIGKAFDDAFPGGTWDAAGTGMGEMLAEFHSTASAEALEANGYPPIDRKDCIDGVESPCRITVSFQFILAPDLTSVSLAEVKGPKPMKSGEQLKALIGFVYK